MTITRQTKYRLPDLPELKAGGNVFTFEGKTGYSGSIIRRSQGALHPFWHYGLVLGFDKRNTLWIIELTKQGVWCNRMLEFTAVGKYPYEITYFVENETESNLIVEKAKEFSLIKFKLSEAPFMDITLNCESFVNFCHGKGKKSWQVQISTWLANILLTATEINILQNKAENVKYLKGQINALRNSAGIKQPEIIKTLENNNKH